MLRSIFSTPIYGNQILGSRLQEVNQELHSKYETLDKVQNKKTQNPELSHDISRTKGAPMFSENVISDCPKFSKFLEESVEEYFNDLGYSSFPYKITSSWFTRTLQGKHAPVHSHCGSDISGVYYLQTNGSDGVLTLRNPFFAANGNFIYFLQNHYHKEGQFEVPLIEGALTMWPSIIEHTTYVNTTSHERISLSFNITISRF